jgi:type II secretory pathway component PulK
MKRAHGFALIAVLWVIAALAGVVGLAVSAARLGQRTSLNRLALTRGRWAAEACLAIAEARWSQHRLADTATEDLGRGTRCAWRLTDVAARLNINNADPEVLGTVLCRQPRAPCALDAILSRRSGAPFVDLEQIAALPAVDSSSLALLTVDGPGAVNVNAAPPSLLSAFPGLTPEMVAVIQDRQFLGRPIESLDALVAAASPAARAALLAHYGALARQLTFAAPAFRLTILGWVEGTGGPDGLHASLRVLAVPLPDRLAVVERKVS